MLFYGFTFSLSSPYLLQVSIMIRLGQKNPEGYHMFASTAWITFLWLQVEAVKLITKGKAPRITQPQEGATYECIQKKDNSKVSETKTLLVLRHNNDVEAKHMEWASLAL